MKNKLLQIRQVRNHLSIFMPKKPYRERNKKKNIK